MPHPQKTSPRVLDFLATTQPASPCLVVDLDVVEETYGEYRAAMPETQIYYAIKANPAPEILERLAKLGSCFDAAAVSEIEMALAAGATPETISYGNTIKKERDIARAFELGVDKFAVDCLAEVEKVARAAPGAQVFCRLLADGKGADWALSRKFGCTPDMAVDVLFAAHRLGLVAEGICFHVGSQQPDPNAFDLSLAEAAYVFKALEDQGLQLNTINLGGGFPAHYLKSVPEFGQYADAITKSLRRHFGNRIPKTVIEPGRGLVGDAGTIKTEVVLISTKSPTDTTRWVYLDIGKFGGLAETADEAIRYPITSKHDGGEVSPCILAGPTCDSVDVMYEKDPYPLPVDLAVGDELLIEATGAYTSTYASAGFNGIAPLQTYVI